MKLNFIIGLFCITITLQAQKLPENSLDKNAVLIFNPSATVDDNHATLAYFADAITESGFNLVGQHLFTNTLMSRTEIELDMKNKNVAYIFLLTYKYYKGPDYDLYFFENDKEKNPLLEEPKKEILKLKPGFVTSGDPRNTIIKKLNKEVDKLKEKYPSIDSETYDKNLLNEILLTKEDLQMLKELNNRNTIVDGVTLTVDFEGLPEGLKSGTMAVVAASEKEYRKFDTVNDILKDCFKKYPYAYEYFKSYEAYEKAGGDKAFTHRIQVSMSSFSFLTNGGKKFTASENYKMDMDNNRVTPSISSIPKNYQKDLFTILIKDNASAKRYAVSDLGFLKRTVKDFIDSL